MCFAGNLQLPAVETVSCNCSLRVAPRGWSQGYTSTSGSRKEPSSVACCAVRSPDHKPRSRKCSGEAPPPQSVPQSVKTLFLRNIRRVRSQFYGLPWLAGRLPISGKHRSGDFPSVNLRLGRLRLRLAWAIGAPKTISTQRFTGHTN